MVTRRGRADVARYMAAAPDRLRRLLVGAGRAAGNVVAEEAKVRSSSADVDDNIVVTVRSRVDEIIVRITVKEGWARSVGTWLEYGTSAHFITVDDEQRGGRSAGRINRLDKAAGGEGSGPGASLVIGGNFVGGTVHHPGARPHPFLRPALDTKAGEAIAAAQSFINARAARGNVAGDLEPGDSE